MDEIYLLLDFEDGTKEQVFLNLKESSCFKQEDFYTPSPRPVYVSVKERNFENAFVPVELRMFKRGDGFILTDGSNMITSFKDNSEANPLKLFIFENTECLIPKAFNTVYDDFEVARSSSCPVRLFIKNDQGDHQTLYNLNVDLDSWKRKIIDMAGPKGAVFFHHDASSDPVQVDLGESTSQKRNEFFLHQENVSLLAHSFMTFTVRTSSPFSGIPEDLTSQLRPEVAQSLVGSFKHKMTAIGRKAYQCLRDSIAVRYADWKLANQGRYIAALASLCQGSGSGKSKMAHQLPQDGPGVYTCLRNHQFNPQQQEDAYPPENNISMRLVEIIKDGTKADSLSNLLNKTAQSSQVGSILDLIASVLFSYTCQLIDEAEVDDSADATEAIKSACLRVGPKVVDMEPVHYPFPGPFAEEMIARYRKPGRISNDNVTVRDISDFIASLMKTPEKYVGGDVIRGSRRQAICTALTSLVTKFPLMFVVDEAHLLAGEVLKINDPMNPKREVKMNGFEVLRRAVSYMNPGVPVFFLTLGTKSVILDMNPPVTDSYRRSRAYQLMPPIILSGNVNIMRRECGYGLTDFEPTHETLPNPHLFKLHVTCGLPLWCSYPFDAVVQTAVEKIKNSTTAKNEQMLVAWLARTPMTGNPKHADIESLVAKRMATLFNLSSDLSSMSVMYPPSPVLGMACRQICNEEVISTEERLFKSLFDHSGAVETNKGDVAESMALMTILMAIDRAPNAATILTHSNYQELLDDLLNHTGDSLKQVFSTRSYILEEPEEDVNTCIQFTHHHRLTTVKDFLVSLYGEKIEAQLAGLPSSLLEGLVNASHFAKLSSHVSFDPDSKMAHRLPLPNKLVDDPSRNIIDRSLLRYGLIRQCGFAMPNGYHAYDAIIPVCLKERDSRNRPIYTFISIQVKANRRVPIGDVIKMAARLQYVPCARGHLSTCATEQCDLCDDKKTLDAIFENQLALLISLGPCYEEDPRENKLTFSGIHRERKRRGSRKRQSHPAQVNSKQSQQKLLQSSLTELYGTRAGFTSPEPCKLVTNNGYRSMLTPRIIHMCTAGRSVRLFGMLWNDAKDVQVAGQGEEEAGLSDQISHLQLTDRTVNRNHRLFAIASDGLEAFKSVFPKHSNSVAITAEKILHSHRTFFGDTSTVDLPNMINSIMEDVILPAYNEDLLRMRDVELADNRLEAFITLATGKIKAKTDELKEPVN